MTDVSDREIRKFFKMMDEGFKRMDEVFSSDFFGKSFGKSFAPDAPLYTVNAEDLNAPLEYKVLDIAVNGGDLEAVLNKYGKKGWEFENFDGSKVILSRWLEVVELESRRSAVEDTEESA